MNDERVTREIDQCQTNEINSDDTSEDEKELGNVDEQGEIEEEEEGDVNAIWEDLVPLRNLPSADLSTVSEVTEEMSNSNRSISCSSSPDCEKKTIKENVATAQMLNSLLNTDCDERGSENYDTEGYAETITSGSFLIDDNLTEPIPAETVNNESLLSSGKSASLPDLVNLIVNKDIRCDPIFLQNSIALENVLPHTKKDFSPNTDIKFPEIDCAIKQLDKLVLTDNTNNNAKSTKYRQVVADDNQPVTYKTSLLGLGSLGGKRCESKVVNLGIKPALNNNSRDNLLNEICSQSSLPLLDNESNASKRREKATFRSLSIDVVLTDEMLNTDDKASQALPSKNHVKQNTFELEKLKKSAIIDYSYFYYGFEEDEDVGVHADCYQSSFWIHITRNDEKAFWRYRALKKNGKAAADDGTNSEREFTKQYEVVTHRLIHRKASMKMFERMLQKTFRAYQINSDQLSFCCRFSLQNKYYLPDCDAVYFFYLGVDKHYSLLKSEGEFGFRIHGRRPVVVSAVEEGLKRESQALK